MGVVAGSAQAASAVAELALPFIVRSSADAPVESMPGWLQPVAEHQSVTAVIGTVGALSLGADASGVRGHQPAGSRSGARSWRSRRCSRPGHPPARPLLAHSGMDAELLAAGARVGGLLTERGETVGVAEGSCGGLVSAALLAVPGASAYYAGGAVVYTLAANRAFLEGAVETPTGLRGATEGFATYLARSVVVRLRCTWGIGEGGAAGPTGNRYGDPAGHAWLAVAGPTEASRHLLTGSADRLSNMTSFAVAALGLLAEQLGG